jgi:predicted MPP superfamily phosphohydrolase
MVKLHPRWRRLLLGAAVACLAVLADAVWLEPRKLLFRQLVKIDLASSRVRVAHLSDLHIRGDTPLLHRLVDEVAAAKPDLIVVSGDFLKDLPHAKPRSRHTAATAAVMAALRRVAPVLGVQGHSEHQGDVVESLRRAGVDWLSNEGRLIGPGQGILLLGLNQQVGEDLLARRSPSPFRPMTWKGRRLYGARFQRATSNFYSHYDPAPTGLAGLADTGGPLAWSGYEVVCDVLTLHEDSGASIAVHSRYPLGEDRLIRLRRVMPDRGLPGTYYLVPHGTVLTGTIDTGVEPEPGRWYRVRLRTEVEAGVVRVKARVWPAGEAEPERWQAEAEDHTPSPVAAGTVGLWSSGEGPVIYRNLRVTGNDGRALLEDSLELPPTARRPAGFREGARGTRLEMALARSPAVPPGTPTVVLAHSPDVVLEASTRALDAVIAGHTHGGQVRLPFLGAVTTRSGLGPYYDWGRFEFNAPNARGYTTLYVNPGVGMSLLPIRFLCPPRWALLELGRD